MAKTDILCNNPGSRVGHAFFVFAFLLVVVASITSLALFALKHDEIRDARPPDSNGHCILYLDQAQVESKNLGGGDFCRFAIYGSGTVALGAAIYLIGYVIKCVVGAKL